MPTIFGSSQVQASDYDAETSEMTVTFSRGQRYVYAGVPPDVADGIHHAPSAGAYMATAIKPFYTFRRV